MLDLRLGNHTSNLGEPQAIMGRDASSIPARPGCKLFLFRLVPATPGANQVWNDFYIVTFCKTSNDLRRQMGVRVIKLVKILNHMWPLLGQSLVLELRLVFLNLFCARDSTQIPRHQQPPERGRVNYARRIGVIFWLKHVFFPCDPQAG